MLIRLAHLVIHREMRDHSGLGYGCVTAPIVICGMYSLIHVMAIKPLTFWRWCNYSSMPLSRYWFSLIVLRKGVPNAQRNQDVSTSPKLSQLEIVHSCNCKFFLWSIKRKCRVSMHCSLSWLANPVWQIQLISQRVTENSAPHKPTNTLKVATFNHVNLGTNRSLVKGLTSKFLLHSARKMTRDSLSSWRHDIGMLSALHALC